MAATGQIPLRQAAGGIGGLLAVCDPNDMNDPADTVGDFVYTYDANGNVGQLIDRTPTNWNASTVMVARYEYDPYGKVTQSAGRYAGANPFRFSTKWFDAETGLGYWGERYYWPELGRWLNRDPIGDYGGVNLYAYAMNAPTNLSDLYGWLVLGPPASQPCPKEDDGGGKGDSGPPIPPNDGGRKWNKPYGTCDGLDGRSCTDVCSACENQYSKTRCYGATDCQLNEKGEETACWCVCGNRIRNSRDYEDKKTGGARGVANDVVETCTRQHELIHVAAKAICDSDPEDKEECRADFAALACIEKFGIAKCRDSFQRPARRKECYRRLWRFVHDYTSCIPDTNKDKGTVCPAKDKTDCEYKKCRLIQNLNTLMRYDHERDPNDYLPCPGSKSGE